MHELDLGTPMCFHETNSFEVQPYEPIPLIPGSRLCVNAGETTYCLCISSAEGAWEKLSYTRLRICGGGFCSQKMETLLVWGTISGIQWSQEFKIPIWSEGIEYEAETLDGIPKGLQLWFVLPPW